MDIRIRLQFSRMCYGTSISINQEDDSGIWSCSDNQREFSSSIDYVFIFVFQNGRISETAFCSVTSIVLLIC
jgi:hypothetical protein